MKKILFTVAMIICGTANASINATHSVCDGTTLNPCTVQDTSSDSNKITNWRDARMLRDAYKGNTDGLKHLWVSISGAPSEGGFKDIKKDVNKATDGKYKRIIDLDLREETHAYLNGHAITLVSENNWINKGKTHDEALLAEKKWIDGLETKGEIDDVLSDKQYRKAQYDQGVSVKVSEMLPEKDIVEKLGYEYVRLTVSDHLHPRDSEVDLFINMMDDKTDSTWLHIHCRGGKGRSTTFFAMADMLRNANKVAFMDIIKRQASVKPYYDLSDIDRKNGENSKEYQDRYNFLQHFYSFATDRLNGYTGNWSKWLTEHDVN